MLRLTVSEDAQTVEAATVPVRWQIDPETLVLASRQDGLDCLYVLLCITRWRDSSDRSNPKCEQRLLVPVYKMMEYVTFRGDGPNMVSAVLVSGLSRYSLETTYLSVSGGRWAHDVFESGDPKDDRVFMNVKTPKDEEGNRIDIGQVSFHLPVNVPASCFAEVKNPGWHAWANRWWKEPPQDECDFRRRSMFASTIQPILEVFIYLFRLGVAFGMMGFLVRPNFEPLFHPLNFDTSYLWYERSYQNDSLLRRTRVDLTPFAPIIAIPLLFIFQAISSTSGLVSWMTAAGWVLGACALVSVIMLLVSLVVGGISSVLSDVVSNISARRAVNRGRAEEQRRLEFNRALTVGGGARLQDLPADSRTVHLRVMEVKATICRPFSQ